MEAIQVPPHSIESEMSILGAIFLKPEVMNDVALILKTPDMFFRISHGEAYRAMLALNGAGKKIDWISVLEEMRRVGTVDACGGDAKVSEFLMECCNSVASANGLEGWASAVRDHWIRRQAIEVGRGIASNATQLHEPTDQLLSKARAAIDSIADGCIVNEPVSIETAIAESAKDARLGGVTGETMGLRALDQITSGWRGGQLIIVGARPGCGKSALVTQMAEHHQGIKRNVAMFSLEMSHREISERLVAMRSGVDARRYRHWQLTEQEKQAVLKAEQSLHGALWIDDSSSLTPEEVALKSRRLYTKFGLKLVIVDYVQLLRVPGRMDRHLQIGECTRRLKTLARELDVPVVVAAQLNRESVKDKRPPTLADLRESGNIEQDADQVILIHWVPDGDIGNVARTELIVAKNRGGPCGTVELEFQKAQTRFRETDSAAVSFSSFKPSPGA